jgi:hypothetical protein
VSKQVDPFKKIIKRVENWNSTSNDKHQNPDQIWFPKSKSDLIYYRMMLQYCCNAQLDNISKGNGAFFIENDVGKLLAEKGAMTRPGVGKSNTVSQYSNETSANKPERSSFRMTNRIFRFLGLTIRHSISNSYLVTPLGFQWAEFQGQFPSRIGNLSEKEFLAERLINFTMFAPHDQPSKWDTKFKNRLVVNILRCADKYGYITNNELAVTAFSLQKETPTSINKMLERLTQLHDGKITMIDAFKECNIDPYTKSAVTGVYDSPKVLLNFCREVGFFKDPSEKISKNIEIKKKYQKMHAYKGKERNFIPIPEVINVLTDYGREILNKEIKKKVINFEDFL